LIGSAYSNGGISIIDLGNSANSPGELDLVITSYNAYTYESSVTVLTPNGAFVAVDNVEVDYGLDNVITPGESIDISVSIENLGNESSSAISMSLVEIIDNPYITITDGTASLNSLLNGSSAYFNFSFIVSNTTPMGHTFALELQLETAENNSSTTLNMTVQALIESFESGNFSSQEWQFGGDADWTITLGGSDGSYSGRSGTIDNNMTSELSVNVEILQDGYIRFDKKSFL